MAGAPLLCDDCAWACGGACALVRPDEQPYFQAYRVAKREPGELRAGWEYLTWIGGMWTSWRKAHGVDPNATISEAQHEDFATWLHRSVGFPEAV